MLGFLDPGIFWEEIKKSVHEDVGQDDEWYWVGDDVVSNQLEYVPDIILTWEVLHNIGLGRQRQCDSGACQTGMEPSPAFLKYDFYIIFKLNCFSCLLFSFFVKKLEHIIFMADVTGMNIFYMFSN